MKKETLIKVIDEEFGDGYPLSWLIEVVVRALVKNDARCTQSTDSYDREFKLVMDTLSNLENETKELEKATKNKFEIKKPRGK